jgi:hypothetical protein
VADGGAAQVTRLETVWVRDRVPYQFLWQQQLVVVQRILDYWRDIGEWWHNEPELWFWRVQSRQQGVYELAWDPAKNQWWLYYIYD